MTETVRSADLSYCRFTRDSDVYMYLNAGGWIECCACGLMKGRTKEDWQRSVFRTTHEALLHLEEHRAAGHMVPDDAIERLKAEEKETDEWLEENDPGPND